MNATPTTARRTRRPPTPFNPPRRGSGIAATPATVAAALAKLPADALAVVLAGESVESFAAAAAADLSSPDMLARCNVFRRSRDPRYGRGPTQQKGPQ